MARNLSVFTKFRANDQMSKPMRRMGRNVNKFGKNARMSIGGVGSAFKRLRGLIGTVGTALVAGKIAKSISSFAEAGDEVAKGARQMGLGVEALQELRFAAERQGVTVEDMTKAFEAMNNRVGQLRSGQGSLSTQLRSTNPELMKQLQATKDSEQAFMILMDAIHKAGSASDKAALAQAAFGRSGQTLVRMAEAGTQGLDALRQKARDTGTIMSEQAAHAAEKFQDAMTNLKATMAGVRNKALTPLIQSIRPLIGRMAEWVSANKDLIAQKIQNVFGAIANAAKFLATQWKNGTIPAILGAVAAFKAVTLAITGVQGFLAAIKAIKIAMAAGNLLALANPVTAIAAAIAAAAFLVIKNWEPIKGFFIKLWDGIKTAFSSAWNWIKDIIDKILEFIQPVIDKIQAVGEFVSGVFGGGDSGGATRGFSPMSPNSGLIQSRHTEVQKGTLDVNINNAPRGTQVYQRGNIPNVTHRLGYAGGGR